MSSLTPTGNCRLARPSPPASSDQDWEGLIFSVAPALPVVVQAVTFTVSSACLRQIPRRASTRTRSGKNLRHEISRGLHHLWTDRTLRALAAATTLQGAGTWMLMAVLVLYALETFRAPAAGYGLLITAYAVGSLAGTALNTFLARRVGARLRLSSAALAGGLSIIGLSANRTFAVAAAAMLVLGVAIMILNISAVTLRQQHTPQGLLGRVSSAFNVLNVATAPVVGTISGLIASHYGLPAALAAAGITFSTAAPLLALGLPTPPGSKLKPLQLDRSSASTVVSRWSSAALADRLACAQDGRFATTAAPAGRTAHGDPPPATRHPRGRQQFAGRVSPRSALSARDLPYLLT